VLGPVLFIVCVNDICELFSTQTTVRLFADDTKIYTVLSDSNMEQCLQSCLDSISRWSDHWQLTLSPTKCTVLHVEKFVRDGNCFRYFMGNHALPTVTPSLIYVSHMMTNSGAAH